MTVSMAMPARFYTSPDIYEIEKDAIFYKSSHYAGHASQIKEERSYITTSIHDQNIFIAKGSDGELRAFYNVCAHRGHILLEGSGRKSVITCPYHAWAFDFSGKLVNARNLENFFNKDEFSLKEVKLEVFCGMLMVNLDLGAKPFAEQFKGLEEEIRHYMILFQDSLMLADVKQLIMKLVSLITSKT